jgi:hypothetical protein
MKFFQFIEKYRNKLTIVSTLREDGLLYASRRCDSCGEHMHDQAANRADGVIAKV